MKICDRKRTGILLALFLCMYMAASGALAGKLLSQGMWQEQDAYGRQAEQSVLKSAGIRISEMLQTRSEDAFQRTGEKENVQGNTYSAWLMLFCTVPALGSFEHYLSKAGTTSAREKDSGRRIINYLHRSDGKKKEEHRIERNDRSDQNENIQRFRCPDSV